MSSNLEACNFSFSITKYIYYTDQTYFHFTWSWYCFYSCTGEDMESSLYISLSFHEQKSKYNSSVKSFLHAWGSILATCCWLQILNLSCCCVALSSNMLPCFWRQIILSLFPNFKGTKWFKTAFSGDTDSCCGVPTTYCTFNLRCCLFSSWHNSWSWETINSECKFSVMIIIIGSNCILSLSLGHHQSILL